MAVSFGSNLSDWLIDFSALFILQIFVGKIPRDLFEDELVPLFEKAGPVWDLRLMMDPLSGLNRGYAFLTFCTKEAAQEAVKLVRHSDHHTGLFMNVYLLPLSSSIKLDSQSYLRITPENLIGVFVGKMWLGGDRHGCCFASEALQIQLFNPCFSPLSVTIMKFARANILACVYQWQTTDSLWAPFPRARQKNRLLKSFPKSQVSIALK